MVIIGYVRLLLVIEFYPWLWNVIIGCVRLLLVIEFYLGYGMLSLVMYSYGW